MGLFNKIPNMNEFNELWAYWTKKLNLNKFLKREKSKEGSTSTSEIKYDSSIFNKNYAKSNMILFAITFPGFLWLTFVIANIGYFHIKIPHFLYYQWLEVLFGIYLLISFPLALINIIIYKIKEHKCKRLIIYKKNKALYLQVKNISNLNIFNGISFFESFDKKIKIKNIERLETYKGYLKIYGEFEVFYTYTKNKKSKRKVINFYKIPKAYSNLTKITDWIEKNEKKK